MSFYNLLNKYRTSIISISILVSLLIFLNSSLLRDAIYESDDYKHHAVRIANYYLAAKQGQVPVRWGPNLNQSYGYPSFNYMYHTPYILGSLLHASGFSIQQSLNLTVLLSILIGAIGCYVFVKSYLLSEKWSVLLSLTFILNPYTLLNIYWRGAVGELLFYAIVPFFLLGVRKLLQQSNINYFLFVAFSTALLTLSHLPSMFILSILTIFFIFSESSGKFNFKNLLSITYAGFLGLLLSSWYWIPAYFEQWMVTYQKSNSLTQYITQFVSFGSILDMRKTISSSDYFLSVVQIGVISIFAIVISIYLLKFSKKIMIWIAFIFGSIFFISNYSKFFWDKLLFLQYLQYPWRFLWPITIASIIILIKFVLQKGISKNIKRVGAIIVIIGLFFSGNYISNKGSSTRTDFDWYHPTFETGSSFDEHQPIWSNIPYYFPDELMYVNASESAMLATNNLETYVHKLSDLNPIILRFDGRVISYEVDPDQDIVALQKRLFYPGWEAFLDEDKSFFIDNIPEYKGILALNVPNKKTKVSVVFTGYTKLRRLTEIVSFTTLLIIIGSVTIVKYYDKNKRV